MLKTIGIHIWMDKWYLGLNPFFGMKQKNLNNGLFLI